MASRILYTTLRQPKALLTDIIVFMRERTALLWAGLIVLFFLVSFGIFLVKGKADVERVFLFPDVKSAALKGELRRMRNTGPLEDRILAYLEDLVLGPTALDHTRLLPGDTKINSVLFRGDKAYVDFSRGFLFLDENEIPLSYGEILSIVGRSIRFNFRKVKEVIITIDGQEP